MNTREKILDLAVTALLILAVVCCITVVGQTLSKGYVTLFGRSLFRVATGSMEPEIPVGALLVSKETEIAQIEVGDIICFRSKESNMLGQVITHRVVSIRKDVDGNLYLETRGDANYSVDAYYVTEDNFIGIAEYYTGKGNPLAAIYTMLTSQTGFLALVVFPVILIAGFIMQNSVNSLRKEMAELRRLTRMEAGATAGAEAKAQEKNANSEMACLTEEEYNDLVARLKQEVLEEVSESVELGKKD